MAKFKVGDKVRVVECTFENSLFKIGTIGMVTRIRVGASFPVIVEDDNGLEEFFKESELEIYIEEDRMGKTFREVIADIKEGEIWEGGNPSKIRIRCSPQGIEISGLDNWGYIGKNVIFKLQRKEYTFEEAFKAYEEGKEIESVHSGYRYKLKDKEDLYISKIIEEWVENTEFDLGEIRGKWYIND